VSLQRDITHLYSRFGFLVPTLVPGYVAYLKNVARVLPKVLALRQIQRQLGKKREVMQTP
jgi:hypothetical protein